MFHHIEIKGRKKIGTAHRAARVSGFRSGDHSHDIPSDLGCDFFKFFGRFCHNTFCFELAHLYKSTQFFPVFELSLQDYKEN